MNIVVWSVLAVYLAAGIADIVRPRLWLAYVELAGIVVMLGLCIFRFCSILAGGGWGLDYAVALAAWWVLGFYQCHIIRNRLRLKKEIERAIALSREAP